MYSQYTLEYDMGALSSVGRKEFSMKNQHLKVKVKYFHVRLSVPIYTNYLTLSLQRTETEFLHMAAK